MMLPAPDRRLRAAVVVPARDEELRIGRCLAALAGQHGIDGSEYEVILVLDGCTDRTAEIAASYSGRMKLHLIDGPQLGVGAARGLGMDMACSRLQRIGRSGGLIATTDADSWVAEDWLASQLAATAAGAEAIGGHVKLDPAEAAALAPETISGRERRLRTRARGLAPGGATEHAHFAGASIGITAAAYRRAGGLRTLAALEDEHLARRLEQAAIAIHRLDAVRVHTSARLDGRAPAGLAHDLAFAERTRREPASRQ